MLIKSSASGTAAFYYEVPNEVGAYVIPAVYSNIDTSGYVIMYNRKITITSDGFHVNDSYGKTLNSNTAPSAANTTCIPWEVFGLKA